MRLPVEAVHQHAASVREISDKMLEARAAAGHVAMNPQAYGQLCQFLPAVLDTVFDAAVAAMTGSVEALHETATSLRLVALTAERVDESAARSISTAAS